MQRRLITVPDTVLRFTMADWEIDWRGIGAGQHGAGGEVVVHNAFPRWVAKSRIFLRGDDLARWRAIRAHAQGRLSIYRIRMCDPVGAEWGAFGGPPAFAAGGVPFAGGISWSTGQNWLYRPFATADAPAPAGAEQIDIDTTSASGFTPRDGQIMSADDWPFVVTSVRRLTGANRFRLGVQMPLRAPIQGGARIDLIPIGRFVATEDAMGAAPYGAARISRVALSLTENLNRR